jgi:hypothetical protein
VLLNQILSGLHAPAGAAPSNFGAQLPAADSELVQQLTRDPCVLDFLDLAGPVADRDLETALVAGCRRSCSSSGTGSRSSAGSTVHRRRGRLRDRPAVLQLGALQVRRGRAEGRVVRPGAPGAARLLRQLG